MAVFRVEKNEEYTVMSNYHLWDRGLSLEAKGLLSQMLTFPEDCDCTLTELARMNREQVDVICEVIHELECAGYIVCNEQRDGNGRLRGMEYIAFEQPTF